MDESEKFIKSIQDDKTYQDKINSLLMVFSTNDEDNFKLLLKNEPSSILLLFNAIYHYVTAPENKMNWQNKNEEKLIEMNAPFAEACNDFLTAVISSDEKDKEDFINVIGNMQKLLTSFADTVKHYQEEKKEG